jgi:inorganic pyrophosphatase
MTHDHVVVIVEIPQGSRNKYEYDAELGAFRLDRMLFSSVHYPADYGYVKDTLAEDGDPLDAMVLVDEPTFPGCAIYARPVGLLKMRDEKGPDMKILTVPATDPRWRRFDDLADILPHLLREIENFFSIYKQLERKDVAVQGWGDKTEAWKVIDASKRAVP